MNNLQRRRSSSLSAFPRSPWAWSAAIALLAPLVGSLATATDEPLQRQRFVYKKVDSRELEIFVTTPSPWDPKQKHPAIVFFHGGGWVGGKPGQFDQHAEYLAGRGMVCFQVQYRLLNRGKAMQAPDICIHDAKSAMRWVRLNSSRFGVDPKRIASAGGSAGGHLAACVGMIDGVNDPQDQLDVSAKSNAMVLFNPVFDNGPGGWGAKRVGKRFGELSPRHNISKDDPPALVFLGSEDKLIPVSTLESFAAAMKEAGVRCEYKIFEGEGHGFFNYGRKRNRPYNKTIELTDRFLTSLGWISERESKPDLRSGRTKRKSETKA